MCVCLCDLRPMCESRMQLLYLTTAYNMSCYLTVMFHIKRIPSVEAAIFGNIRNLNKKVYAISSSSSSFLLHLFRFFFLFDKYLYEILIAQFAISLPFSHRCHFSRMDALRVSNILFIRCTLCFIISALLFFLFLIFMHVFFCS